MAAHLLANSKGGQRQSGSHSNGSRRGNFEDAPGLGFFESCASFSDTLDERSQLRSMSMRRREFTAGALMLAAMQPAGAQPRAPQRRIAIFHPAIPVDLLTETGGGSAWRAFFGELRLLGYIEGQ